MLKAFQTFFFLASIHVAFGQQCECGKGMGSYGDGPNFIYKFSDSQSISFCGSIDNFKSDSTFYGSEFSVFTCAEKEKLVSYSAVQTCHVIPKKDTIVLDRIIFLYNGPNSAWKEYSLSQRIIFTRKNKIKITEEKVILSIPDTTFITSKMVYTADYNNMNYDQMSDFLGKLEILALNQDQKAVDLLFSEQLKNATNAATREHLILIRATYNWVIKGIKNNKIWW